MLEMVPGFHTQKIVEEIFRLSENTSKSAPSSDNTRFDWLEKYINSDTGKVQLFWEGQKILKKSPNGFDATE